MESNRRMLNCLRCQHFLFVCVTFWPCEISHYDIFLRSKLNTVWAHTCLYCVLAFVCKPIFIHSFLHSILALPLSFSLSLFLSFLLPTLSARLRALMRVCMFDSFLYIICLYLCRSLVPWPYNIFLASKIRNIPMLNGAFAIKIQNHVIWRLHRRYLPFECLATFYRFLIKVWSS